MSIEGFNIDGQRGDARAQRASGTNDAPLSQAQASDAPRASGAAGANPLRRETLSETTLGDQSSQLLEAFKSSEVKRHSIVCQELSFKSFLKEVLRNPRYMIRNTFQYTADAMESFGYEKRLVLGQEILDFSLRKWPWESSMVLDKKNLEGQELALNDFHQQMKLFGRREYANRMFIFHGPPGSGKTRLNDTLDAMLEHFSEFDPRGALYRLAWVFSEENLAKPFGFAASRRRDVEVSEDSTAHGSRLIYRPIGNTDPLFLLSTSCDGDGPREKLLHALEQSGRLPADLNRDYLLRGELDTFSEAILETLLAFYREELKQPGSREPVSDERVLDEVLNRHVRVERYTLSRRQGRGLCSIWGSANRNADIEPFYSSYSPPPGEIRAAERDLHMPTSFMLRANRGHLHFSDIFRPDPMDRGKDDISGLNHLLNEIESGHTQILSLRQAASCKTEKVNVLLRADANDELIAMKTSAQGWDSLRRRMQFINVPHVTRYLSEAAAHKPFFRTIVGPDRFICPHVLKTISLFATATRLIKPDPSRYKPVHEQLPKILGRMSVVEKALFLQEPKPGIKFDINMLKADEKQRWSQDDLSVMQKFLPKIAAEYTSALGEMRLSSLYDGGFGISTANAQDLLRQVAVFRPAEPITVLEVLEVLKQQNGNFPYYEKIAEAKQRTVQGRLEEKKQEALRQGKAMSESEQQQAIKSIADSIEKQFPIPSPEAIIAEVEAYAKRMVQEDFYTAMGIASEEQSTLSLRRYLAHARVSIGQPPHEVEPQHRVTERERGHNNKLLEDFEDRVVKNEDLSTPHKRQEFRRHLFEQIGNWQAEHPTESVSNSYEQIFGELVVGMRKVQKESLEKPLKEFEQLSREYAEDPLQYHRDLDGKEDERRRAQRWMKTIRALEDTLKYPREEKWETIRKHLEWAVKK